MATLREMTRRDGPRRKPKVAFVLSGGGNLGAIQVGMLHALVERDIVPDVVLGCSVGALNGAGFALEPNMAGVEQLAQHWRSTTSHELMPSSRIPSALQLLRKGAALHSNEGLRAGIERLLGPGRRFDEVQLPFQCVATHADLAVEHWFEEGDLTEAILASAALPAVYPPVVIDGQRYVDGGVVDNVPIARAVELGCKVIYVLHVGPHGRPDAEIRRPLDGALQAYWIARNTRFARDLASLPPRVEAVVLPPGKRPELRYSDFTQTDELVAQGYENSARFLDERKDQIEERRRGADLLRPIERLVLGARNLSWRQAAEDAATSPDGAILTGDEPEDDEEDGIDDREGATEGVATAGYAPRDDRLPDPTE
jgi:NTE family protein